MIGKWAKLFKFSVSASSLTFVGFLFLLCFSWFLINKEKNRSHEDTHRWLQEQFQVVVSDYVEEKHPHVQKITFHKIFTKRTARSDQVQIFFSYALDIKDEASGELFIEGEALLSQKDSGRDWLLSDFRVTDSSLEFSEPLFIRASPSDSPPDPLPDSP